MLTVRTNFAVDALSLAKARNFSPDKIVAAQYGTDRRLVSIIVADAGDVFPIFNNSQR